MSFLASHQLRFKVNLILIWINLMMIMKKLKRIKKRMKKIQTNNHRQIKSSKQIWSKPHPIKIHQQINRTWKMRSKNNKKMKNQMKIFLRKKKIKWEMQKMWLKTAKCTSMNLNKKHFRTNMNRMKHNNKIMISYNPNQALPIKL